jgi:DNA-binding CsgD family transcriptional regulator/pimeloyl-ACP methyl ester carboxylesterase
MTQTLDTSFRTRALQYAMTDDGYRIAYSVSGEGEPFLFTPCLLQSDILRDDPGTADFVRALQARFKLVRYDGRGTGNSTRGLPPNLRLADTTMDMLAVIRELHLDRFILYADVFTAYSAFQVAIQLGSAVKALVLVCPQDLNGQPLMAEWEAMYTSSWEVFTNTWANAFWGVPGWSGLNVREIVDQEDFVSLAMSARGHHLSDLLPNVKVPTLILCQRNPTLPYVHAAARKIASAVPGAEFVILEGRWISSLLRNSDCGVPPAMPVIDDFLARIEDRAGDEPDADRHGAPLADLSLRELEVLRLLAAGRSNQEIAESLVISASTVAKHVSSILGKTGTANRVEVTTYAHRHRLV